jgi:5-(carboxyamino)imidazole ribonucleotide synthase
LARVGIIGGGQLGRMLALAGIPLGLEFRFLDPAADAPAGEVGELLVGEYDDPELLDRLADGAAAVTYEFENVPVEAARRAGTIPSAAALEAAQDRLVEKQLFRRLGIPTARIDEEVDSFPAILKARRFGYDGKGQRLVET